MEILQLTESQESKEDKESLESQTVNSNSIQTVLLLSIRINNS